jgi:methyltransferase (TIGR00027 family)
VAGAPTGPEPDVAATAVWTAMCRAEEARRPRARVTDPHAAMFVAANAALARRLRADAARVHDAVITRTVLIDRALKALSERGLATTFVNLGAGFDARPYRLDLPPGTTVVEVDGGATLAAKTRVLAGVPACCTVRRVPGDACRPSALDLGGVVDTGPVAAVTEGLLCYLRPHEQAALARWIRVELGAEHWVTDVWSSQSDVELRAARGPTNGLRVYPVPGPDLFAEAGWQVAGCIPLMLSLRRDRPPMGAVGGGWACAGASGRLPDSVLHLVPR